MPPSNHDPITEAFKPILGLPAWGVDRGQDNLISFDFGEPHLVISEPRRSSSPLPVVRRLFARRRVRPHGQWYLFVWECHWRIMIDDRSGATRESSDNEIREAIQDLDGQKLLSVGVDHATRRACFRFDLGATFETWPEDDSTEEQWSLSMPDGRTIGYRADGRYRLSQQDDVDVVWLDYPDCVDRSTTDPTK